MRSLFNQLFSYKYISPLQEADESKTGLISPYSLPQKDVTAIAIDELDSESRIIGYIISTAYKRCSPAINILKKSNPLGFLEFKARIIDTLDLNNILSENMPLRDQLAEIFASSYQENFLVFKDSKLAEKAAITILNNAKKSGLRIPSVKLNDLLKNILITVLTIPSK